MHDKISVFFCHCVVARGRERASEITKLLIEVVNFFLNNLDHTACTHKDRLFI